MSGPLQNPRDHRRLSNFRVGVIAAVLIAFLSYLSATKRLPFTDGGYEVKAVFSSVNNELTPRSPVRIAGVEVGTVTAVEEGPGNAALVTMEIDDDGLPIHADATARIRPRLFLEGNYFVEMTPGSPSAPELAEGGQLPVTQTANSVRLDEVVDVLDADTRTSLTRLAKGLSGGLAKGGAESFNSSLDAWQGAFRGLSTTMEDLRGTEIGDLSEFVASQALVSQALADRDEALADLIVEFRRTTGALASRPGNVSATIREAARTAATARPALAELSAALPSLRRFAIGVRPALREAPPALDDAIPFLDQVDKLVKPRALRGLRLRAAAGAPEGAPARATARSALRSGRARRELRQRQRPAADHERRPRRRAQQRPAGLAGAPARRRRARRLLGFVRREWPLHPPLRGCRRVQLHDPAARGRRPRRPDRAAGRRRPAGRSRRRIPAAPARRRVCHPAGPGARRADDLLRARREPDRAGRHRASCLRRPARREHEAL